MRFAGIGPRISFSWWKTSHWDAFHSTEGSLVIDLGRVRVIVRRK
jgi:hypothetical protein